MGIPTDDIPDDLHRIYLSNYAHHRDHGKASELEGGIVTSIDELVPSDGKMLRAHIIGKGIIERLGFRNDDGYLLLFDDCDGEAVVYAIFHEREEWWVLKR